MTTKQNGAGLGTSAAQNKNVTTATTIVSQDPDTTVSRCGRCRHPLTAAKSIARGIGPVCCTRDTAVRNELACRLLRLAERTDMMPVSVVADLLAAIDEVVER